MAVKKLSCKADPYREDPFGGWHPNKSVRKIRNGSKTSNQAEIRAFPEIYGTESSGRHAGASLGSGGQPADELRHVEYLGW